MLVKEMAQKAGLRKRVYPHLFRHSRATELANVLTDQQMKQYFGWGKDSAMVGRHTHLSGKETDKAILEYYGEHKSEMPKEENPFEPEMETLVRELVEKMLDGSDFRSSIRKALEIADDFQSDSQ